MAAKIDAFLKGSTNLPALPNMIGKLLTALDDQAFSTAKLSQIIATDTSLAARVLKMANSVFYFRMEKIATVDTAAVRLGRKTIRSLVLTVWTQTFKSLRQQDGELGLVSKLLEHGTATAVGASLLIKPLHAGLAEEAYVAGLLHDIGQLALSCQLGRRYENDVLAQLTREQKMILAVENDVLGFDHAMLGERLLKSWNIPAESVKAAARHHDSAVDPAADPVVAAVALADELASRKWQDELGYVPRSNVDEMLKQFRITDLTALEEQWNQRLQSLQEALATL